MTSMIRESFANKTTSTETSHYTSYLLRLRWTERDGQPTCQVMLTSVVTKEQQYFGTLEETIAYLRKQGLQKAASQQIAFAVD